MTVAGKLRIGILGAARIAPSAVIKPALVQDDVEIVSVAARDASRAARFAKQHGIPKSCGSYAALLADPDINAVYNPLPNGLHGRWTIAALEAGKHVLCEKPFTANADEAEAVAAIARSSGLVTMEAFHYRYHALTRRLLEIIASGELGKVRRIEASMCFPLPMQDIRWDLALAGGALMDAGCYAIHLIRTLADAEPIVTSARAKLRSSAVDRLMQAEFGFADGRTASITASMLSARLLSIGARVIGTEATMDVSNFVIPQLWHRLKIKSGTGVRKERVAKLPSSYSAQLRVFADAVLHGHSYPTNVDDAIANMRVIDACYAAAGLSPRQPAA
jgi:predicted dehydrogenase